MLSVPQQFDLATKAISRGDVDLLEKILTDPMSVTIDEQRTTAQKLGIKGGFLSAAVNTFSDPVIWLAFLMSKRFPSRAWLQGTIPKRFIGAANEFTGISQFVRPVETYFRGTTIPRLTALEQFREAEVRRIGDKVFKAMERPNWSQEMPLVSAILEGHPAAGTNPELFEVAKKIRAGMEETWGLLSNTKKIVGGMSGDEITAARAENWPIAQAPRHLRDYLPHIPLLGEGSVVTLEPAEALKRMGMGKTAQILEAAQQNPADIWTVEKSNRLGSNFNRYQMFLNRTQGQVFNPNLFRRQRMNIPLQSLEGQELFVTDLNVVLQKYFHSAARTYALNAPLTPGERALAAVLHEDGTREFPTDEPIIVQVINQGLKASGARMVERPVPGTDKIDRVLIRGQENPHTLTALQVLTRNLMGQADEGEILMGNLFSAVGRSFDEAAGRMGYKPKAQVDYLLRGAKRDLQWRSAMNGITSYFYASTLGLNPWSALQNLLQPIITTAPAIGVGSTLAGVREMGSRMGAYSRAFSTEMRALEASRPGARMFMARANEAAQTAFNGAFPELARAGLKLDPRLFDVNPNSIAPWGPRARNAFRTYDDFARFLLQPFTHAELANQATTFYGSRNALRKAMMTGEYEIPLDLAGKPLTGAAMDHWLDFESGMLVNTTQFRPGPGTRSIFQSKLPAPLRMFTTFPTRAFSFFTESMTRGAMTEKQLETAGWLSKLTNGRNLGTLARVMLYGRLVQNGASDILGIDLSKAVGLSSPFTWNPQGEFLSPLPVPPIAGAVVGTVSAAANRDVRELKPMYLPGVGEIPIPKTLFPGGVAITRAVKAAQSYQPDLGGFVDDDRRLMYRGNSADLILGMLGIPTERNRRSRDYFDRVTDVRQRVTRFRRSYAQAYANYDVAQMRTLEVQWHKAFPDWPPLSITGKDAQRYEQAARMPMIQRMMRTMGEAGHYLESELYEVDPELLDPFGGAAPPGMGLGMAQ